MELTTVKTLPKRSVNYAQRIIARKIKGIRQRMSGDEFQKQYLFIVGCQRSGTSMMYKTFEHDPNAGVYDEISILSNKDKQEGLRFNDLANVLGVMGNNPASLVVAKPLVESQNLIQLLDYFPKSKAIWMFRPYKDVVNSNLKRFGNDNGFSDIEPIISDSKTNWRSEKLDEETRELILNLAHPRLSRSDAAALFWYARNSLYFQQQNSLADTTFLCNYDVLVSDPEKTIQLIYDFLNREFPGTNNKKDINVNSIGKGNSIELSDEVDSLCESMLKRLLASQQN